MNRSELIFATAIILFLAFLVGCFSFWLVNRLTGRSQENMSDLDRLAQDLQKTEAERDQALMELERVTTQSANTLQQKEAELQAAMEGLRDARQEAQGLRTHIEQQDKP